MNRSSFAGCNQEWMHHFYLLNLTAVMSNIGTVVPTFSHLKWYVQSIALALELMTCGSSTSNQEVHDKTDKKVTIRLNS